MVDCNFMYSVVCTSLCTKLKLFYQRGELAGRRRVYRYSVTSCTCFSNWCITNTCKYKYEYINEQ